MASCNVCYDVTLLLKLAQKTSLITCNSKIKVAIFEVNTSALEENKYKYLCATQSTLVTQKHMCVQNRYLSIYERCILEEITENKKSVNQTMYICVCCLLLQLFDADNPINLNSGRYMFTTEGHVLPLAPWLRQHTWEHGLFQDDTPPPHTNLSFASVSIFC